MLVERGAVEAREALRVGREMRRDPVEDDAEARAMRAVDEARESGRLAEAAGRREQADRLVAPGFVERMLADRQQLDVGVAHPDSVGDELVGQFVVGEKPSAFAAPPRPEMDLVDRHRLAPRFALAALGHVFAVGPGEIVAVGDDGGGRRPKLGLEAERIGLERQQRPVRADKLELVDRADGQFGDEDLPQAAVEPLAHLAAPSVPLVEVADHGHPRRIRRPDREQDAVDALVVDELGAEPAVELAMRALADEIVVHRTERRPERVRVDVAVGSLCGFDFDSIGGPLLGRRDQRFEEVVLAPRQIGQTRRRG